MLNGKTLTGFYRKIIYNNIAPNHENILVSTVSKDSGVRDLVIKKFDSAAERLQYLKEEKQKSFDEKVSLNYVSIALCLQVVLLIFMNSI